jgi:predicted esterase
VPSFVTALDQLDAYIAAEGPFEGVLAFSQGAGLVATHLVRKHFLGAASPFRCAILIAPISVYDPAAYTERGEVRVLGEEAGPLIHIPTVVMWGERDERKEESRGLVKLCEPSLVEVFVHEGGHEVPGLGVKESIPGAVKVVRRGVSLAALSAA